MFRPLHEQSAHTPRSRMNQHKIARLGLSKFVNQVVRRHTLQRERRALFEREFIRQRNQPARIRHNRFAIGARNARERDSIGRLHVRDAFADGLNHSSPLYAGGERHLAWVRSPPLADIHKIHARGHHPYHRLSGSGLFNRSNVFQLQNLWPANLFHTYRFHINVSSTVATRYSAEILFEIRKPPEFALSINPVTYMLRFYAPRVYPVSNVRLELAQTEVS